MNLKSLCIPWLFIYISLFSADCKRRNKCLDGNPSKETNSENWQKCALQCFNDINGECFNWSFFARKCSLFNEETITEIRKSGCVNGAWDCYEWIPPKLLKCILSEINLMIFGIQGQYYTYVRVGLRHLKQFFTAILIFNVFINLITIYNLGWFKYIVL